MLGMGIGPFSHRLERVTEAAAGRSLVDFDDMKDLEDSVPVVKVQLHAANTTIELNIKRRVAVVQRGEIAARLGPDVVAIVRADALELIDRQLFNAGRG